MPVSTCDSRTEPTLEARAAIRAGANLTIGQKREFIRHAMLARGPEWVRDYLRVPPDAVSVDHWTEGMVEKGFAAALMASQ